MKIATFNINNVNRRLPNLLAWLEATDPDVVCLQELKAAQDAFPGAELANAGYEAVWKGQRQWNGVAILGRGKAPILTRDALPGDPDDQQSRYIEAAYHGVLVASIYLTNGNPRPGPKFDYKLAWFDRLEIHARELMEADVPVVLAGDYNVVPTDLDIYRTTSWTEDALTQPEPRSAFQRLTDAGWTDAIRTLHPTDPMFSFWDYKRQRWPQGKGLRLDHLLLSPAVSSRLSTGGVDRDVRGKDGASDHAPVWIELADEE